MMQIVDHFVSTGAPLFLASPAGHVHLDPDLESAVDAFCTALRQVVGSGASVKFRAYRAGAGMYLAIDVTGTKEDRGLTLMEGDRVELPTADSVAKFSSLECAVTDAVDCFYLAWRVLDSLSPASLRVGPRITTK
jgi:hypothetical protein